MRLTTSTIVACASPPLSSVRTRIDPTRSDATGSPQPAHAEDLADVLDADLMIAEQLLGVVGREVRPHELGAAVDELRAALDEGLARVVGRGDRHVVEQ